MPRFENMVRYDLRMYYPDNKGLELFLDVNGMNKHVLDFNNTMSDTDANMHKFYTLVRDVLAGMTEDARGRESENFFIYLLSYPRRDARAYLEPLLSYFHILGYLKFKKNIYNDNKQKVVRYRVEYKNKEGKLLFIKRYSSLAQLSDDVGKKMTSLHYQLYKIKTT